jgi:hypothetical protein
LVCNITLNVSNGSTVYLENLQEPLIINLCDQVLLNLLVWEFDDLISKSEFSQVKEVFDKWHSLLQLKPNHFVSSTQSVSAYINAVVQTYILKFKLHSVWTQFGKKQVSHRKC